MTTTTTTTPRTLAKALAAQAKAVDVLLMPPPPPKQKQSQNQTQRKLQSSSSTNKENNPSSVGTAPSKTSSLKAHPLTTNTNANDANPKSASPLPLAALKKNAFNESVPGQPKGAKRKSVTPNTPRPLDVKMNVNQLSRNPKPKPFHQKLLEASSTPPPKAIKAGSKYGTPVSSKLSLVGSTYTTTTTTMPLLDNDIHDDCKKNLDLKDKEIQACKDELEREKLKVVDLEIQVQSRNAFIGRIEIIAKTTSDKLAVNQTMLMNHLEESRNFQTECQQLRRQLKETLPFLPNDLKMNVLRSLGLSEKELEQELLIGSVEALRLNSQ
ncbi:UNVERIFIED_CONTAM: hypothetical protein HDU68_008556 [Siphonaria sp. JEL0065]|nr:hypothetical protein HDU68_008556 [Siphonaria sp. JEL0065]